MVIGDFNDIVCLSIGSAAFVGSTYFFCKTVLQLCLHETTSLKEEQDWYHFSKWVTWDIIKFYSIQLLNTPKKFTFSIHR